MFTKFGGILCLRCFWGHFLEGEYFWEHFWSTFFFVGALSRGVFRCRLNIILLQKMSPQIMLPKIRSESIPPQKKKKCFNESWTLILPNFWTLISVIPILLIVFCAFYFGGIFYAFWVRMFGDIFGRCFLGHFFLAFFGNIF